MSYELLPEHVATQDAHADLGREISEGLSALLRDAILRTTTACTIAQNFFLGVYSGLVVFYMARARLCTRSSWLAAGHDLGFGRDQNEVVRTNRCDAKTPNVVCRSVVPSDFKQLINLDRLASSEGLVGSDAG